MNGRLAFCTVLLCLLVLSILFNFVIFKNNEFYLVVPASVCHLVYFHLYRTCRNGATSLSEGLSLKPGTTSLSS